MRKEEGDRMESTLDSNYIWGILNECEKSGPFYGLMNWCSIEDIERDKKLFPEEAHPLIDEIIEWIRVVEKIGDLPKKLNDIRKKLNEITDKGAN